MPSLFGLLQVTGCVNITWFIGCDKSCTLSCPAESSACIQISWLALNWPLCVPLLIQIIKANAVPLCPVKMGMGTVAASRFAVCLGWKSKPKWRWDAWGRVGGDVALTRDGRGDSASWGTPWLCPPKQEATVPCSSLREEIRFTWPPLPCHQPYKRLLILTRSACVTTYNMTPPPANPAISPSLNLFALAHMAELPENRYDALLWMWQYQPAHKKINKAAVHSPLAQKIVFQDCSTILLRVTGTLLLLWRRLITLEATESKQAIIYQKTTMLLFHSP